MARADNENGRTYAARDRARGSGRTSFGSVWLRREERRRGHGPALSREQIVHAAIEIADQDGIDAITMRRIAQQLGAGVMSLYWHVASKEELLDLVFDEIYGEIELSDDLSGDWRADTSQLAHATRAVLLRHPWLVSIVGSQPALGPNLLRHIETALRIFVPLGVNPGIMLNLMGALDNLVMGFVVHELQHEAIGHAYDMSEDELWAYMGPYLEEQLATGQYPVFGRVLEELPFSKAWSADEHFQFGLDCMLNGIAAQLDALQAETVETVSGASLSDAGDSPSGNPQDLDGRDPE